jgi:plastocyanin
MRGTAIALAAAIGGMLLLPATPLADEPPAPPKAVLEAPSTTVPAGKPVELDSSASTPGSGVIVGHVWDLDGDGSFETDTGAQPKAQATPKAPGPFTVQVRVIDDHGQGADAKLPLTVTAPPPADTPPAGGATAQGPGLGFTPTATPARVTTTTTLVPPKRLRHQSHTKKPRTKAHKSATVKAAAATGVTIQNFKFSPGTSSVHVGDTITWTNRDIAPHTATAKDGSFDTGTINKNKSGSHTFTKAGSFAYICSIHPSMKGTVTVLASSSGGSGGSGSGGTSSGTSGGNGSGSTSTPSSSSPSNLPHTGFDIAVVVLIAMCMTGSGMSLRHALR